VPSHLVPLFLRSSLIARITKRPSWPLIVFALIPDREDHEAAILAALL
jgi:hypothetical protein